MTLRNAAILAADVVGYTRLIADSEEQTLHLLTDLQTLFWETITRFNGRAFNTAGDAIRAEFTSTASAVEAALELQQTLHARNAGSPLARQMMYRIGIAAGEVVDQDGDVHGTPVTLATALEGLAAPGGLCISKAVYDDIAPTHAGRFADLGIVQSSAAPLGVHAFTLILDRRTGSAPASPSEAKSSKQPQARKMRIVPWAAAAAGMVAISVVAYLAQSQQQTPLPSATTASRSAVVPPTTVIADAKPAAAAKPEQAPAPKPTTPDAQPQSSQPVPTPAGLGNDWLAIDALRKRQVSQCAGSDWNLAITSCRAVLQTASLPDSLTAELQANLGAALRQTGKTDEAIEALSAAIKLVPEGAAYNNRGLAQFEKGNLDAAIEDFSAAIKLKPDNGDALNNRAWTQYKAGRLTLAAQDAKLATTHASEAAYVWDTSGHINEAMGRKQAAIENYRRALALDPKQEASRSGLTRLEAKP
ncbi:MAG: tetratricopeptide repeat protein [Hyphomicrobiaceae bacterium]